MSAPTPKIWRKKVFHEQFGSGELDDQVIDFSNKHGLLPGEVGRFTPEIDGYLVSLSIMYFSHKECK